MNELTSGLVTREALMLAAGFDAANDLRRARHRTMRALRAVLPSKRKETTKPDGSVEVVVEEGGAPDYPAQLKAADQVYAWHGLREQKGTSVQATFTGPIQITWTLPSPESSVSSPPPLASGPSTNGSNGSTSSSATGDSGKPSWL